MQIIIIRVKGLNCALYVGLVVFSRFGLGFFAGTGVFTFFLPGLLFGVHGTSTGRKNDPRITSFLGSV